MKMSIAIFVFVVVLLGLGNASLEFNNPRTENYDYPNTDGKSSVESFKDDGKGDKGSLVLLIPVNNIEEIKKSDDRKSEGLKEAAVRSRQTRCKYPKFLGEPKRTTVTVDPSEYISVSRSTSTAESVESSSNKRYLSITSLKNAKSLENSLRKSRQIQREDENMISESVILQPRAEDSVVLVGKKSKKSTNEGSKRYVCYCVEEDYETTKSPREPPTSNTTKRKRRPDTFAKSRDMNDESHEKSLELAESKRVRDGKRCVGCSRNAMLMEESGSSKRSGKRPIVSQRFRRPPWTKVRSSTTEPCLSESKTIEQPTRIALPLTDDRKFDGNNIYRDSDKWRFVKNLQSVIKRNEARVASLDERVTSLKALHKDQDCVNDEKTSHDAYEPFEISPDVPYRAPYFSSYLTPQYPQYPPYPPYPRYDDGSTDNHNVVSDNSANQPFVEHGEPLCNQYEATALGGNFVDIDECIRLFGLDDCIATSVTFDRHKYPKNDPEREDPTIGSLRQEEARYTIADLPLNEDTTRKYPKNAHNTHKHTSHPKSQEATEDDEETLQRTAEYPENQVYELRPIPTFRYIAMNQPTRPSISDLKYYTSTTATDSFIGSKQHQTKTTHFDEYDNHVDQTTPLRQGDYLPSIQDSVGRERYSEASERSEKNEIPMKKVAKYQTVMPRLLIVERPPQAAHGISKDHWEVLTGEPTKENDDESLSEDISKGDNIPTNETVGLANHVTTSFSFSTNNVDRVNPAEQKVMGNREDTTDPSDSTTRLDHQVVITEQSMSLENYLTDDKVSSELTTQSTDTFFTEIDELEDYYDHTLSPESQNSKEFSDSGRGRFPPMENKEYEATSVLGAKEPEYGESIYTTVPTTSQQELTVSSWPRESEHNEDTEEATLSNLYYTTESEESMIVGNTAKFEEDYDKHSSSKNTPEAAILENHGGNFDKSRTEESRLPKTTLLSIGLETTPSPSSSTDHEGYGISTTKQVTLQTYHNPDPTDPNVGLNKVVSQDKDESELSPKDKAFLRTLVEKVVKELKSEKSNSATDERELPAIVKDFGIVERLFYLPEVQKLVLDNVKTTLSDVSDTAEFGLSMAHLADKTIETVLTSVVDTMSSALSPGSLPSARISDDFRSGVEDPTSRRDLELYIKSLFRKSGVEIEEAKSPIVENIIFRTVENSLRNAEINVDSSVIWDALKRIIHDSKSSGTYSIKKPSWHGQLPEARSTIKPNEGLKNLPIVPVKERVFKDGQWTDKNTLVGDERKNFQPEMSRVATSEKDEQIRSSMGETSTINANELGSTVIAMDHQTLDNSVKNAGKELIAHHQSTEFVVGMTDSVYGITTEGFPAIYISETSKEGDENIPTKYYSPNDIMLTYIKKTQAPEIRPRFQETIAPPTPQAARAVSRPIGYSYGAVATTHSPASSRNSIEQPTIPTLPNDERTNKPWQISTSLKPITDDRNNKGTVTSELSGTINPLNLNGENRDYTREGYVGNANPWSTKKTVKNSDIAGDPRGPMFESTASNNHGNNGVKESSTFAHIEDNLRGEMNSKPTELSTSREFYVNEYARHTTEQYVVSENRVWTKQPEEITDEIGITESTKSQNIPDHSFHNEANSLTTGEIDRNFKNFIEGIVGLVNNENVDQDVSRSGYRENAASNREQLEVTNRDENVSDKIVEIVNNKNVDHDFYSPDYRENEVSERKQLGVTNRDEGSSGEKFRKIVKLTERPAIEVTTKTSIGASRSPTNGLVCNKIPSERVGLPRDKIDTYETAYLSSIDRSNFPSPKHDPTYFGKITLNSVNPGGDKISDLTNTDLFYIGDGVKIPLKITRMTDGYWGLSISEKICENFVKRKCPCCVPSEGDIVEEKRHSNEAENGNHFDYLDKPENLPKEKGRYARSFLGSNVVSSRITPVVEFAKKYNLTLDLTDFSSESVKPTEDIVNPGRRDRARSFGNERILKIFGNKNQIRRDDSRENEARIFDNYYTEQSDERSNVIKRDELTFDTNSDEFIENLSLINVPEEKRAEIVVNALDGLTISASTRTQEPMLDYRSIIESTEKNSLRDQSRWSKNDDYELTMVTNEMTKYGYQRDNPIFERVRFIKKKQLEQGPYKYQRNVDHEAKERMNVMKTVLKWLKKVFLESTANNET